MNKIQDTLVSEKKTTVGKGHEERLLDEAVAETFPASDPISPAYAKSLEPVAVVTDEAERWRAWLKTALPYMIAGAAGAALYALLSSTTAAPRSRFETLRDTVSDRVRRLTRR